MKNRIESALRDTKKAMPGKDAALASECAEVLKKVMQEAGAVLYSQSGQAAKGGPCAETRWEAPESQVNVGSETGGPRPGGVGPVARWLSQSTRKTDKTGSIS